MLSLDANSIKVSNTVEVSLIVVSILLKQEVLFEDLPYYLKFNKWNIILFMSLNSSLVHCC